MFVSDFATFHGTARRPATLQKNYEHTNYQTQSESGRTDREFHGFKKLEIYAKVTQKRPQERIRAIFFAK
jgi:hypothetical protein